jgi:hypothetical protein
MHRPRSGMVRSGRSWRTTAHHVAMVRCIDAMIEEMDAVAELMTGKPAYFHDKGTTGNR